MIEKSPKTELDARFSSGKADYTGVTWGFEAAPEKVFGFGRGEPFSQTCWRF